MKSSHLERDNHKVSGKTKEAVLEENSLSKSKTVDINILLNRIKIDAVKQKKEKLILFGFVAVTICITGIFTVF
tara:strand:+ start:312 stop:533 length:222 start_codon:yes stop_codon:yes gene_type:complete